MENSFCWQISMHGIIEFTHHITAMLQFHSIFDCCYLTVWQSSATANDLRNNSVVEAQGAEAVFYPGKCLMNIICTDDKQYQQYVAYQSI